MRHLDIFKKINPLIEGSVILLWSTSRSMTLFKLTERLVIFFKPALKYIALLRSLCQQTGKLEHKSSVKQGQRTPINAFSTFKEGTWKYKSHEPETERTGTFYPRPAPQPRFVC